MILYCVRFEVLMAVKTVNVVSGVEDGDSMFLQNVGYLHTSPHGVTTQKTNIDMMIF
jgi:hypothetical protein